MTKIKKAFLGCMQQVGFIHSWAPAVRPTSHAAAQLATVGPHLLGKGFNHPHNALYLVENAPGLLYFIVPDLTCGQFSVLGSALTRAV